MDILSSRSNRSLAAQLKKQAVEDDEEDVEPAPQPKRKPKILPPADDVFQDSTSQATPKKKYNLHVPGTKKTPKATASDVPMDVTATAPVTPDLAAQALLLGRTPEQVMQDRADTNEYNRIIATGYKADPFKGYHTIDGKVMYLFDIHESWRHDDSQKYTAHNEYVFFQVNMIL